MRKISILGSTGVVGRQTLEVIRNWVTDIKVAGLACNKSVEVLAEQIREFEPQRVSVGSLEAKNKLEVVLKELKLNQLPEIYVGEEGLEMVAQDKENDLVLGALMGAVGIKPIVAAIRAGKDMILANKEVLVCAGELVMSMVKEKGVNLYTVDSEHSAIWQCLKSDPIKQVSKLVLTCSGGPLYGKKRDDLLSISADKDLVHPNWKLGPKIGVDCATLMNKGLEVIEAHWLFGVDADRIEAVIHRESIIHSLVEFIDGSVLAQLGPRDMRIPIQYALTYPERLNNDLPKLDLIKQASLTFSTIDHETFPCVNYAVEALLRGGTMPCALNAANEIAVQAFLNHKIKFLDIAKAVRNILDIYQPLKSYTIEDVYRVDEEVRQETSGFLGLV